jgi:uncharacterized membrane protein
MSLFSGLVHQIKKPHNFYLVIAVVAGITISFLLPPFNGNDEASHIYRIYEFSNGDILLDKGATGLGYKIPDALRRVNVSGFSNVNSNFSGQVANYFAKGQKQNGDSYSFQTFEGAGVYPPMAYLNYLPTSFLVRIFNNINEYIYSLTLRISGLIVCILLIYAAIRFIPIGKWFVVSIGLLPMSIYQMSVVSTDGLLIASSILFVSLILYTKKNYDILSNKKWLISSAILLVLAIIISSKPGYWPLLLFLLLIPKKFNQLFKRRGLSYPITILIAVVIFGLWYSVLFINNQTSTKHYFEQANKGSVLVTKKQVLKEAINPITLSTRLSETYVVQPPLKNISGSISEANYQPDFIFRTFVGVFGPLNIYPPSWLTISVIGSLILGFLIGPFTLVDKLLKRREKYLAIIVWAVSFLLISFIFWVSWTPNNMPVIFGVQGRYFIPLLPVFLFLIPKRKLISVSYNKLVYSLLTLTIINLVITLLTIYNHYYY